MSINTKDLSLLIQEASALSNKPNWTKQDEKRNAFLLSAISAVKAGASLSDLDDVEGSAFHEANEAARRSGLPVIKRKRNIFLNRDREAEARGWKQFIENRDMEEGAPMLDHFGTYTSLGNFIPTGFFPQVVAAMAAHDVLFDEDSCTVLKTQNGIPTTIPLIGDIENVAAVVGEGGTQNSVDISSTNQATLIAYSYKTPRFVASIEAFQDMDTSITTVGLFKQFTSDRLARGIAKDLVTGNGSSKPLGLIPSLEGLGVSYVTASGSADNTGGSESGATTLGSADFAAAAENLDQAYVDSPKCAWLMNRKTLIAVSSIINKFGNQLNLVQYVDGQPFIYGIPVKICPSIDNLGASNVPVVLGDLTYWCTRLVVDEKAGLMVYREAPGLIEYGNIGISCFMRADGELLYKDTSSPAPFTFIRNHS